MSCSNWKIVKLESCAVFKNGKKIKEDNRKVDGKYSIYGSNGVIGRTDEVLIENEAIVIGRVGAYCGAIEFSDESVWITDNAISCINKENTDIKFLYYLLTTIPLREMAGGSAQPLINQTILNNIEIKIPGLEEQKMISDILYSLDKKIELNNEMNKTLEEMAQALFKRWFVDFEFPNEEGKPYKCSGGEMIESELGMMPKEWKVEKLQDISDVTMGVSPSSSSYNEDKIGLPLLNGAADFEGKLIKPSKYTSEPKKTCKVGDMVFGVRATIGNTVFADKEYALGRGVASVSPKSNVFREFIYFCLNSSMNKLINSASGSVFLNLKKADITDLKLCYSETAINRFNKITKALINKIIENDNESEILKQQRDLLLPKLMSGEIKVDNIEADL